MLEFAFAAILSVSIVAIISDAWKERKRKRRRYVWVIGRSTPGARQKVVWIKDGRYLDGDTTEEVVLAQRFSYDEAMKTIARLNWREVTWYVTTVNP